MVKELYANGTYNKMYNIKLKNNHKTGAALITVLIIVFMIMAIISNITIENYRAIKRLANQKSQEQAQYILKAATSFGRAGLATSASTSKIDTLQDIWAQPIPKSNILNDIQMSGYIIDEQGKFNINDLVSQGMINKTVVKQFETLLDYLNLPSGIALATAQYMASPVYQNDIMNQYTMNIPSYRPAGRPLIDISELTLVKGIKSEWVYKLSNYITAIPQKIDYSNESGASMGNNTPNKEPTSTGTTQINVNTASAEVISAKSGIPLTVSQRLITYRVNTPFNNSNDVLTFLSSNGVQISRGSGSQIQLDTLVTSSQYFTIHAIVDDGDYEFKMVSMVFRLNRSGQWPQILWQHPE